MPYICLGNGCSILENDALLWGFLAGKSWAFLSPEIAHPTPVVRRFPASHEADLQRAHFPAQTTPRSGGKCRNLIFFYAWCVKCVEKKDDWWWWWLMMATWPNSTGQIAKLYGCPVPIGWYWHCGILGCQWRKLCHLVVCMIALWVDSWIPSGKRLQNSGKSPRY